MNKKRPFIFLSILIFSVLNNPLIFATETSLENTTDSTKFEESVDSKNRLRSMLFDDEIFIPEIKGKETVLINKAGNAVSRDFYDEQKRLIKKEIWEITDSLSSKVTRFESFVYKGSTDKIKSKTVYTSQSEEYTEYNDNGLPVKYEVYKIWDNADQTKVLKRCTSVSVWMYDGESRLLAEKFTKYYFKTDDDTKSYKKESEQKNYVYHDSVKDIPPDEIVYVNGKKKSSLIYMSPGEYITDMIFDNGYTVKTFYKEGKRIREEFYQDRKLLRFKDY